MKKAYSKYLVSLLLFGSNGVIASYIALNSHEIVLSRTIIGCLFLLGIFFITKQKFQAWKNKKNFLHLIISGAAMGASWMFLYEAYTQVGVSLATLAYSCGPVIVMVLACILFHEKLTPFKLIGLALVLAGIVFVNAQELTQGKLSWGLVCGILSAILYAVMVIANKKVKGISGLENTIYQLAMGFIVVCTFTLVKQGINIHIPAQSILPILFLGIVNTGIGCYLYFSSITHLPAQSVAICGYLEPVSALAFSALFLSEQLSWLQLLGAAFILGGAAFGELIKQQNSQSMS